MSLGSEIRAAKAKAVGGKKDRCRKGKSCSATCISSWKDCLVQMPDVVSNSLNKFAKVALNKASQFERERGVKIPGLQRIKNSDRDETYKKLERKLIGQMTRYSIRGNKVAYEKEEKKLLKLQKRFKTNRPLPPGKVWDYYSDSRKAGRRINYRKILSGLEKKAEMAALRGDREAYDKLGGQIKTLKSKAGGKFGDSKKYKEEEMWDKYKDKLPSKLGQSLAKPGSRVTMDAKDLRELNLTTMIRRNRLDIEVHPDSFSFKVNGSYLSFTNIPLRDRIAIIKELKSQFPEVVRNMKEGAGVFVTAARGDNKEDMREKAYVDFGFAPPDSKGVMYGRVREGKIVPSDEKEFNRYYEDEF